MKSSAIACISVLVLLAGVPATLALSPPWWTLSKQITAALSGDKYVEVTTVDEGTQLAMKIEVAACCEGTNRQFCIKNCAKATNKAKSLATLLTHATNENSADFSTPVVVQVFQRNVLQKVGPKPKQASTAVNMFRQAMLGCSYFVGTGEAPLTGYPLVMFQPKVIQYYADDISQAGGLQSKVAADLFGGVFRLRDYNVLPTSAPCNGPCN